jgi:hypothetical protein
MSQCGNSRINPEYQAPQVSRGIVTFTLGVVALLITGFGMIPIRVQGYSGQA